MFSASAGSIPFGNKLILAIISALQQAYRHALFFRLFDG